MTTLTRNTDERASPSPTSRRERAPSGQDPHARAAQRLQTGFAAVRVSFTWLGVRRTLTTAQKARAAETFGAEDQYLSAAKKLLDTRHPLFKAVSSIRHRIQRLWKGMSLPFPEPGIRLIRRDQVDIFDRELRSLRDELQLAVQDLNSHYHVLRQDARQRLGSLYNPADYPPSLEGLFAVEWDYPNVEPPDYLRQPNPELYQQEARRIAARFDEAVQMAEQALSSELAQLVDHLVERLTGGADGQPKVFRDSAVQNLREFFERFRNLSIGSSEDLEQLVEQARRTLSGVGPQDLRDQAELRQHVAGRFSEVRQALDPLLADRPRRRIVRGRPTTGNAGERTS